MAFGTSALNHINTDATTFKAWVQYEHDAILAAGFIDPGDSGQLDIAGIASVPSTNSDAGFRLYRSNDAAGDLANFFIKKWFGTGSSANFPRTRMQIGWGSDGSGNLTGQLSSIHTITPSAAPSTGFRVDWSGNAGVGHGGRMVYSFTTNTNTHGMKWGIERLRNADLSFRNDIAFVMKPGGSNFTTEVVNQSVLYPSYNAAAGSYLMPPNANSPANGIVGLGIICAFAPGPSSPLMNFLGVEVSALGSQLDILSIPVYGQNRNYRIQNSADSFQSVSTTTHMILYE